MYPARPLIGITVSKSTNPASPNTSQYALSPLYVEGVLLSGGAPLQIPHAMDQVALRTIFERLDGLLLSGGGDVEPAYYGETARDRVYGVDRARDELEMALVQWAIEENKPLLGICRGIQVMNVALGGSLYQDVLVEMPGAMKHAYSQKSGFARDYPAHKVQLVCDSRMARLLGEERFAVNSLHHQGLKRLAPDLIPVGHAQDGLVEAVEVAGHVFAAGVQWHPEELAPHNPMMQRLFLALVEAAQNKHEDQF